MQVLVIQLIAHVALLQVNLLEIHLVQISLTGGHLLETLSHGRVGSLLISNFYANWR